MYDEITFGLKTQNKIQVTRMLGSLLDQDEIEEFMAEADAVKLFLLTLMYTSSPIQEADALTHHYSLKYIHTLYLGSDLRG